MTPHQVSTSLIRNCTIVCIYILLAVRCRGLRVWKAYRRCRKFNPFFVLDSRVTTQYCYYIMLPHNVYRKFFRYIDCHLETTQSGHTSTHSFIILVTSYERVLASLRNITLPHSSLSHVTAGVLVITKGLRWASDSSIYISKS